ncbi:hypothetical protein [Prescottella agglutinans]
MYGASGTSACARAVTPTSTAPECTDEFVAFPLDGWVASDSR